MRNSKRSQRRDETRSKIRESLKQKQREILEEFGCDPNEPHEMIDLQLTQERIERAGAEAKKKQNDTSNTK